MIEGIEAMEQAWMISDTSDSSSDSDLGGRSGSSSSSPSPHAPSPPPPLPSANSPSIVDSSSWVEGAIIVGAGPAGLAVAACLKDRGVPSIVLDKANCIASLWQQRTYDRLHLHIAKQYCELPLLSFARDVPQYPTKNQFIDYLHDYARHFEIQPLFDRCVVAATREQSGDRSLWRVETVDKRRGVREEFRSRWLVVATGENGAERIPEDLRPGLDRFQGTVLHSSQYRNGKPFKGQRVLVVGCGNSGMEIALDLLNHGAQPSIVVRSPMHILPREMFGRSTFAVAMSLMKLLPLRVTDKLLVMYATLALGNTTKYGILRPSTGPLETKAKFSKTPILDMGTFRKIRSGSIKVMPCMGKIDREGVYFENGRYESYDSIILATGYKSMVCSWFKDDGNYFSRDGFPKSGWNCDKGLYAAGMSRQGIFGVSKDAKHISDHIYDDFNFIERKKTNSIVNFKMMMK
ncbi:indole-3-pyruvate monooxygenase YUCCA6 [Selaginella moellendorffii]|nr:indole-3-pyruvate monooxygenase YUCCA6 [Selaginella moellendorffii]|eukprot:XP_002966982.2 indole-3-pyruvate monooxygenase YUCCA6 [Selaginella moellendorffii]